MGIYLNNTTAYSLYQSETRNPYFVDKTEILTELFPLIEQGNRYICITRPRRFGKTVMANMLGAFLGKGHASGDLFEKLAVSRHEDYRKHLNRHDVIDISFNELPRRGKTYAEYIERIENKLIRDLKQAYPDCQIQDEDAVWDALTEIYETAGHTKFIFILDEWDFIFHRDFVSEEDKREFISFLSNLLKDKPYVSLAYMTGILPIAKYSSGSELNMFLEYSMASQPQFGDYFGFTEAEVDRLYERYIRLAVNPGISREELRVWYDGYHTRSGERMYNPRSVVAALCNNQIGSYWTSSGPYDEIFYYIEKNVDDVRDVLALMVAGEAVPAKVEEYAATSMNLDTKDEILSAMVVYGFLSCEDGKVSIPNKELMNQFGRMVQKENSLGYVYRLARESDRMLAATLAGNTEIMEEILSYVHDTETPLLNYNQEAELSAIVNLAYLSARDQYDIQREDKAGIGYVDFIFYPKINNRADGIILELKVDDTPEHAIQQIIDRKYALRFKGKLGETSLYTGRLLLVGIGYEKGTKVHRCKVKVMK
ncbi:MAG: AAA family ATPase [Lachnospiraceae bacterium]|nr:AAA family ATPase [Lachnospiraceae bacterium]